LSWSAACCLPPEKYSLNPGGDRQTS
jgi:hypothetical protein